MIQDDMLNFWVSKAAEAAAAQSSAWKERPSPSFLHAKQVTVEPPAQIYGVHVLYAPHFPSQTSCRPDLPAWATVAKPRFRQMCIVWTGRRFNNRKFQNIRKLTLNRSRLLHHLKIPLHLSSQDLHQSQKYRPLMEEGDKQSTCKERTLNKILNFRY